MASFPCNRNRIKYSLLPCLKCAINLLTTCLPFRTAKFGRKKSARKAIFIFVVFLLIKWLNKKAVLFCSFSTSRFVTIFTLLFSKPFIIERWKIMIYIWQKYWKVFFSLNNIFLPNKTGIKKFKCFVIFAFFATFVSNLAIGLWFNFTISFYNHRIVTRNYRKKISKPLNSIFILFLEDMKGSDAECVVLVLMEMGLSFAGIVTNLLIVTAVKVIDELSAQQS